MRWSGSSKRGRGKVRLMAPNLLEPELGNVLRRRYRRKEISPKRLRRSIWTAFEAAPLTLSGTGSLMPAALGIAISYGCIVYDAFYVALTEVQRDAGAALTADRRLVSRFEDTPFAERLRLLGARSG